MIVLSSVSMFLLAVVSRYVPHNGHLYEKVNTSNEVILIQAQNENKKILIEDSFVEENVSYKVVSIGNGAFKDCWNLFGDLEIPSSIRYIGNEAFKGCFGLRGRLELPKNVHISREAFCGCRFCGVLFIPEGVVIEGDHEFIGCEFEEVKSLNDLPQNIIDNSFSPNTNFVQKNPKTSLSDIGTPDTYTVNGLTYQLLNSHEAKVTGPLDYSNSVLDIPSSVKINGIEYKVTGIGPDSFRENNYITSLTLPEGLVSIGAGAFILTTNLRDPPKFPDSLKSIGESAFYSCNSLTGVLVIPSCVDTLGQSAFSECNQITHVTIPSSIMLLHGYTFSSMGSISLTYLGCSEPNIESNCFDGTTISKISVPSCYVGTFNGISVTPDSALSQSVCKTKDSGPTTPMIRRRSRLWKLSIFKFERL